MRIKIKDEKGVTGIDITIAIIIITIFVAIITTLFYNIKSNSITIDRKTEAIHHAITIIEGIKNGKYESMAEIDDLDNTTEHPNGETIDDTSYTKKIMVVDYNEMEGNSEKLPNIVKKVTVEVSFINNGKEEKIDLSTLITVKEI